MKDTHVYSPEEVASLRERRKVLAQQPESGRSRVFLPPEKQIATDYLSALKRRVSGEMVDVKGNPMPKVGRRLRRQMKKDIAYLEGALQADDFKLEALPATMRENAEAWRQDTEVSKQARARQAGNDSTTPGQNSSTPGPNQLRSNRDRSEQTSEESGRSPRKTLRQRLTNSYQFFKETVQGINRWIDRKVEERAKKDSVITPKKVWDQFWAPYKDRRARSRAEQNNQSDNQQEELETSDDYKQYMKDTYVYSPEEEASLRERRESLARQSVAVQGAHQASKPREIDEEQAIKPKDDNLPKTP
jgi:hypothetical protein